MKTLNYKNSMANYSKNLVNQENHGLDNIFGNKEINRFSKKFIVK